MSLSHNTKTVMDGLICYIDPKNPRCYQGSSSYLDLSGNGNDWSLVYGTHDTTNGQIESAGSDPSNLKCTIAHSSSIDDTFNTTTGSWTIEEIVRIDDTTYPEAAAGSVISVAAYGDSVKGFDWNHGEYLSTGRLDIGMSDGSQSSSYAQKVNLQLDSKYQSGGWMHRSIYWDRANQKVGVWYNGEFQDEGDITPTGSFYDNGGIVLGELYGWRHDGARSIFRIYNRLLTEKEIRTNFNATRDRFDI